MSLFENPTQTIGILAFLSAFLSCLLAGRFTSWSIWRWLAVIYMFFLLEIAIGWRHELRTTVNDVMQSAGIYGDRVMIQWTLVVIFLVFIMLSLAVYSALTSKVGSRLKNHIAAIAATVVLFLLFILELISFHRVDALLYQIFGGIMLIGWMWAGLAVVVIVSALQDLLDILSPSSSEVKDS